MSDRPLTTGEGGFWPTLAQQLLDSRAECGRLREQLDAATAENERLRLLVIAALERAEKAEGTGAPKDAR